MKKAITLRTATRIITAILFGVAILLSLITKAQTNKCFTNPNSMTVLTIHFRENAQHLECIYVNEFNTITHAVPDSLNEKLKGRMVDPIERARVGSIISTVAADGSDLQMLDATIAKVDVPKREQPADLNG